MKAFSGFDALLIDARYAVRAVRKDLGLFAFAAGIVGIGIGACTAIFSLSSPLLLHSLPFEEPERLVWIANDGERGNMSSVTSRTSNLRDFREQSQSFDGLTGYFAFFESSSYNLVGQGEPEQLMGVGVAWDFLDVLGVQPQVGRSFVEEEGAWGGPRAVVLGHGFWLRRFAGDSAVLGRKLTLNNEPYEVVGILPPTFDFASIFAPQSRVDFLTTFPISDETDRWGNTLSMVGRLAPGASVASAQAELDSIITGLQEADAERWGLGAVVTELQAEIAGPFRTGLLLLAAAAGSVMLIVCVNLSNLLLARGRRRRPEMAVRSALGASRERLARQMLIESLILSAGGALLGLAVAGSAIRFVVANNRFDIPLLESASIDATALAFTSALAITVGLLVGLLPALRSTGQQASIVRDGGRASTGRPESTRGREILVVAEVALASVLLVVGGLLLRSFENVLEVDLGFQTSETVAWQLTATRDFEELPEANAYFDQIISRVAALPGVESAGLTDAIPLGINRTWGIAAPGLEYEGSPFLLAFPHVVDHRYLDTMGIPLLEGRHFTPADTLETTKVVILNASAAREIFHGESALGRTIFVSREEAQVIGVVADIRHLSLEKGGGLQIYLPYTQTWDFSTVDMVVRSSLGTESLAPSVATALRELDPALPTGDYRDLEAVVSQAVSPRRFTLQLLGAFSATALLLAALGIYAVLSYSVSERVREIGIRMALGETPAGVLAKVVGKTTLLAAIGLGIGAALSLGIGRFTESLLYGVGSADPSTFLGAAGVLLAVSILAGSVPAWRASRTDITHVLRAS